MERSIAEAKERRIQFYLDKAKEADERAANAADIIVRQTWQDIAHSWRFLAAQTKRQQDI